MHKRFAFTRLAIAASALACLAPGAARAWGDEGHMVVALIAEHELKPAARQKVFAMLAADDSTLTAHDIASEATWADRFRDSDRNTTHVHYNATHEWHFVDIELSAPDIDAACAQHPPLPAGTAASAGPAKDCVADKIDQFTAELTASKTAPAERLLALKFLLHFVGDLHQPLHASDDHDSGGNGKNVRVKSGALVTLHHFWDTEFVNTLGKNPQDIAGTLIGKLQPAQEQTWANGTPTDWAQETFGVARDTAYGKLPKPTQGAYVLPASYNAAASAAVATQLSRAGVRLGAVLNKALAP